MKKLDVYFSFAGNCQNALNFYKDCLNGEIVSKQTFGESPIPVEEAYKKRIMYAEFKAEHICFMASDTMADMPVISGNQVTLSLYFTDSKEQDSVFARLCTGGKVNMPLQETFWGARFGMLTDKFGINWMLNCNLKP